MLFPCTRIYLGSWTRPFVRWSVKPEIIRWHSPYGIFSIRLNGVLGILRKDDALISMWKILSLYLLRSYFLIYTCILSYLITLSNLLHLSNGELLPVRIKFDPRKVSINRLTNWKGKNINSMIVTITTRNDIHQR